MSHKSSLIASRLSIDSIKEKIKTAFNHCFKGEFSMELECSYDKFLRGYEAGLQHSNVKPLTEYERGFFAALEETEAINAIRERTCQETGDQNDQ